MLETRLQCRTVKKTVAFDSFFLFKPSCLPKRKMVYFLLPYLIAKTNIAKAIISCSASNTDNSGSPFSRFDTYIHKHHLLEWIATIFSLFYNTYYKTRLAGLLALFLCTQPTRPPSEPPQTLNSTSSVAIYAFWVRYLSHCPV